MHRIHVLSICCAYAAIIVSPSPTLAVDLYSQNFESVTLGPIVTYPVMVRERKAWTAAPPAGMTVDNSLMPAGVELSVAAPLAHPIDITVSGLSPATTQVQEAVKAELRDMFLRRSRVAGNDTEHAGMPFLAVPTTFSRSWIDQAISNATGEDRHALSAPLADVNLLRTEIPTLGNVTFI